MEPPIPTGYENYPRPEAERVPGLISWENPAPPAPIVRSSQGMGGYRSNGPQGSRRSLLLGVVGVGVVAVIGLGAMQRVPDPTEAAPPDPYDPFDPGQDGEVDTTVLSFGGLDLDVPDGWTVLSDGDTRALLAQGHNQILLVTYEDATADVASELSYAIAESEVAFDGSLGKPKTSSGRNYQRAVATGTGTFEGKSARQIAEVLIGDDGSTAVFIQQVLTAAKDSTIAKETARLAADLRDSWPW